MEEETEIFRINTRLTAALGTPDIEAFANENLDALTRTAPRRSPAASDRTSGGLYVPAKVYDLSPDEVEAEEERYLRRLQNDSVRRVDEERFPRRQFDAPNLIDLNPQSLDGVLAVTVSVQEHEDQLRQTTRLLEDRFEERERLAERHYRERVQNILDERDEAERRYMALQESTRGHGKAHDDTVELLRLASIGRPSVGSRSVAKLTEQQLALGMSDEKLNANDLKAHAATQKLVEKALQVTIKLGTSPMQIMESLHAVMVPLSALTSGKLFQEAVSLAFPFKLQTGDGANRQELRASIEDVVEKIPLSAVEKAVIAEMKPKDRELAAVQTKVHKMVKADTACTSMDVMVKNAVLVALEKPLEKKVASATSLVELIAMLLRLQNFNWDAQATQAVRQLTRVEPLPVDIHTSFDELQQAFIEDVEGRVRTIDKVRINTLGTAILCATLGLPTSMDVETNTMLSRLHRVTLKAVHDEVPDIETMKASIKRELKEFELVSGQAGNFVKAAMSTPAVQQAYAVTQPATTGRPATNNPLRTAALHNPAYKERLIAQGSPTAARQPQSAERRPYANQQPPQSQEGRGRATQQGVGGQNREARMRSGDARGTSRDAPRARPDGGVRDRTCHAGPECWWLNENGECRFEHTPAEVAAAKRAWEARNAGPRTSTPRRPSTTSPGRERVPEVAATPPRRWQALMARQVSAPSFVGMAHAWKRQLIIVRGPLEPRDEDEEDRTAAVVGLPLTEVLKTVCTEGEQQFPYSQQLLDADIAAGLLAEQVVPRNASPVVWSSVTSQLAFFKHRPVCTVNELIERAIALKEMENTTKLLPHGRSSVKASPVVSARVSKDLNPWARPYRPERAAPAAAVKSALRAPKPVVEENEEDDVTWKAKRQRLLQQDREQTAEQKRAFKAAHKGNTLRGIVDMMDTVEEFEKEAEQRRYVKLPSYVSRARMQILSATSVEGRWQILVDTCAELTLFGAGVPHLETGPSDVSLLGVGGTVVNADHKGSFVVVRDTDHAVIEIVHGHMVSTLPRLTVILGWDPLLEEHPRANLVLRKNNEMLWMEPPLAERRIGWNLGRIHSKLVQITDKYRIFESIEAAKAAMKEASVNIVAETSIGVIDSDRHHSPRVTTSTVDQLPALPDAPGRAYPAWIVDKPMSEPEESKCKCPPPTSVEEIVAGSATSWSRNRRVINVRVNQLKKKEATQAAKLVRDAKVKRSVGVRVGRETFEKEDGFVAPAEAVNKKAKQVVESAGTTPVVQLGERAATETVSATADDDNKVRDLLIQLIETKQAQSFIASNQLSGHPCDSVDAMFKLVAHCHDAVFGVKRGRGVDGTAPGAPQQQEVSASVRVDVPASDMTPERMVGWLWIINTGQYTPGELRRLMQCSRHFRAHILGDHPTPSRDPWRHCTAYGPRQPHRFYGQGGVLFEIPKRNAVNSRELVQELVCDSIYGWNEKGDVQYGPATQRHILGTFKTMDSELEFSFNDKGVMSVERVKRHLEKPLEVEKEAAVTVTTVTVNNPPAELMENYCSGGSGPAELVEGYCSNGDGNMTVDDEEWADLMSLYLPPGALCMPTIRATCEAPKCAPPACTALACGLLKEAGNVPELVDTSSDEDTDDDEERQVHSMAPWYPRVYARVLMVIKVEVPDVCPTDEILCSATFHRQRDAG